VSCEPRASGLKSALAPNGVTLLFENDQLVIKSRFVRVKFRLLENMMPSLKKPSSTQSRENDVFIKGSAGARLVASWLVYPV